MRLCLRTLIFLALTGCLVSLQSGCVAIPIPTQNTIVAGEQVAKNEVNISSYQNITEVKARLGEPVINFGPQKVFVYQYTIKHGDIIWLAGAGRPIGGFDSSVTAHVLFIAFDKEGKVRGSATSEFKYLDSVGKQVRKWLNTSELAAHISSSNIGDMTNPGRMIYFYRPSHSKCNKLLTYDSNLFKPSVAIDGVIVGDLSKGEYLVAEITPGEHAIKIDPYPYYRYQGQETNSFVADLVHDRVPKEFYIKVVQDTPTYIETYLCTGDGRIVMHANICDESSAVNTMKKLNPAW